MFVLKPLVHRPIALLWTGQVLAATGSEFYMVAVVWTAAAQIGADAGYISALQAGLLLAGSLFAGMVTDRWRHRTTMIAADLVRAGLVLVLSIAAALNGETVGLPLLALIAAFVALVTSTFDPALQATLPTIASDPVLRHATNGLFDATKRMARILGPSMIALVNAFLPMGQFFTVTAAAFIASALMVRAALRGREEVVVATPAPASRAAAVVDGLLGGFRAVRGQAVVIYGLASTLVGNFAWALGFLLGMVLHLRETSADPLTDYSLMMTAYGIGNLASSLVLASLKPGRPALQLTISKMIFGSGVLLLPLFPDRAWLMAVAAWAALNGPFENLGMLHLIQSRFPPHRVAQVYRLQMCAIFAGLLLAYLVAPTLFGWFGLKPMIMASGALTFAVGAAGLVAVFGRRHAVRAA